MKNLFFAFAVMFFGMTLNAQKNTILVGGNVAYSSDTFKGDGYKVTTDSFEFSPTVGYQFHDNWIAGINAGIGSAKGEEGMKTNAFTAGAFVRYVKPLSETFSVYGDLGAGFQNVKYKYDGGYGETKGDGFYVGFTPALFLNIKDSFGLNFSIGGIRYGTLDFDGVDHNSFNFDFGKTFNIGISKNFKM